jgi:antitoxin component YwqK of YwqJK toxin-antitoxin module
MLKEHVEYYHGGELRSKYTSINEQVDGDYRIWYRNGAPLLHAKYVDGLSEGDYMEWYSDGTPRKSWSFVNHLLQGPYRVWDPTGKLILECNYSLDKLCGEHRVWDADNEEYIVTQYGDRDEHSNAETWYDRIWSFLKRT